MKTLYNKQPSTRQLKVSALLVKELSMIFANKKVFIPSLENIMITVSQAKVNADLQCATIYIMLPNSSSNYKNIIAELNANSSLFSTTVAKRLQLKYSPKLKFVYDNEWEKITHVEKLFDKIATKKK